jgi:replicative DNA helicase
MEITKIHKSNIISLEKGKIPPQAVDLEEVVIGAMMIDFKGYNDIKEILNPEHFYKEPHKIIVESIKEIALKSEPIDLLTVSAQLRKNAKLDLAGGQLYLIQLTQKISSSAHIQTHYKIIQQKYLQRQLIKLSSEVIEQAYDDTSDVLETIESVKKAFDNIEKENEVEQMPSVENQIDAISFDNKNNGGLSSGIEVINTTFGKWQRGEHEQWESRKFFRIHDDHKSRETE